MKKRGQITVFVIVAILIIAVIAGIVYFTSNNSNSSENLTFPEAGEAKLYVEDCLKQTLDDSLLFDGRQGGYFDLPSKSRVYLYSRLPYYFDSDGRYVPSKEVLEREIAKYIDTNIGYCVDGFNDFNGTGLKFGLGQPKSSAAILSDSVEIRLKWSITINKGESSARIDNYKTRTLPIRIPELLQVSDEIADSANNESGSICITCIDEIAVNHNLNITLFESDVRGEYIFNVYDSESNFSGVIPYTYSFLGKYDFPDCDNLEECANAFKD